MRLVHIIILTVFVLGNAHAYRVETHQAITNNSLNISDIVGSSDLLETMALDLSSRFPDHTGKPRYITDLVVSGAAYEDGYNETGFDTCSLIVKNHFYDPIFDVGLTSVAGGIKSPDWALEDRYETQEIPYTQQGQHYSMKDARGYFVQAFSSEYGAERKNGFGMMFEALGHVIHHIQDMAQPEHVRDDIHTDLSGCGFGRLLPFHGSAYELWSKQNTVRIPIKKEDIPYIPKFENGRQYWVTEEGVGKGKGAGMAEFANNNFVSQDTNFRYFNQFFRANEKYQLPTPTGSSSEDIASLLSQKERCSETTGIPWKDCLEGEVEFIHTSYVDKYPNPNISEINRKASTYSIFDQDLKKYNITVITGEIETHQIFSLNRFNFQEMNKLLIPRAVGYSTGLLNHFFRARIQVKNELKDGTYIFKVKNKGDYDLNGDFRIYATDLTGIRKKVGEEVGTTLLKQYDKLEIQIPYNVVGQTDKDEPFAILFEGKEVLDGNGRNEPAVTGFVIDNRKLAFKQPAGDLRKMNPESGKAKAYLGQFGGASRITKHPTNNDLAIVYHPYKDTVHVIDYAEDKIASVKMDRLSAWWQVSARWLDDKIMVASFGVNDFQTRYNYKLFKLSSDHTLEQIDEKSVSVDNGAYAATGGWRHWGHWPGASDYFNLAYGPYVNWFTFDILPNGSMITLLANWDVDNVLVSEPQYTYHTVNNCTNQVMASEIRTGSHNRAKFKIQRIALDGSISTQDLDSGFERRQWLDSWYYDPPRSPQEPAPCPRGDLVKKESTATTDYNWIVHLDIKPNGEIVEVAEKANYSGRYTWALVGGTPVEDTKEVRNKSYIVDGQIIDVGTDKIELNSATGVNIEEYKDVEFWDLQYDQEGKPYLIWRKQYWWFDEPNHTYHFDNTLKFGSIGSSEILLENRHDYFELGPPLEVADVIVDPYREGVAGIIKVRDSSYYAPYDYDVEKSEFIRYKGKKSVDLREKYPQEFAGVKEIQFLP